jgi:integrase
VFQRGSRWWIAYYAPKDGRSQEHRELGGMTEKEARKKLKQRLNEVAIHQTGLRPFLGPSQERITVEELLQSLQKDYEIHGRKSLPTLRSHLRHVRHFFAMDRALAVTPTTLRKYITSRMEAKAAPATINRELEGLQRAFSLAVESGLLATAPKFPCLREDNARQGFLEKADFTAIMAHMNDVDVHDFCEWFYWTGMRPGEIQSLTWAAFDKETWTIRLHAKGAKTGCGRAIGLEGELRAIINRRVAARRLDCPLIFHRQGGPVGDFRKRWKTACKRSGVSYLLYDLRRTAVRNMVRAGVDPAVAMKISGHRTRSVFDRYNIISEDDIRAAMTKTTEYVSALPSTRTIAPLSVQANG